MAMFWLGPVRENSGSIAEGSLAVPMMRSAARAKPPLPSQAALASKGRSAVRRGLRIV